MAGGGKKIARFLPGRRELLNKNLHIVCKGIPWPANNNRNIDVLSRLVALHKSNVEIHLHCITGNTNPPPGEIKKLCSRIDFYPCARSKFDWFKGANPDSGENKELQAALLHDEHPLLLEGLSFLKMLIETDLNERKIVVRVQPGEALQRMKFHKQWFYACICQHDAGFIEASVGQEQVFILPVFSPWQVVRCESGTGNLCLYHGDLSDPENEQAAAWLLQKVFTKIKVPFVIAGSNPSRSLEKQAHFCQHTCLVRDPSQSEMDDLVRKAHIHLLPSFHKEHHYTSIKLIHSLHEGRHCIVNEAMVEGTGLEDACHIGANGNAFASIVLQLFHQPFPVEEITLRKRLFGNTYDNETNARNLIQWLW